MSVFYSIPLVVLAVFLAGCTNTGFSKFRSGKLTAPGEGSVALVLQSDATYGKGLDAAEREKIANAETRALDFGKPGEKISWTSERDDVSGFVTASQPYRVGSSNCRRFTHELIRKGVVSVANGTACRKSEEKWALIS